MIAWSLTVGAGCLDPGQDRRSVRIIAYGQNRIFLTTASAKMAIDLII